jgi:hypothetical protein
MPLRWFGGGTPASEQTLYNFFDDSTNFSLAILRRIRFYTAQKAGGKPVATGFATHFLSGPLDRVSPRLTAFETSREIPGNNKCVSWSPIDLRW